MGFQRPKLTVSDSTVVRLLEITDTSRGWLTVKQSDEDHDIFLLLL
jgi:hypothetical protein